MLVYALPANIEQLRDVPVLDTEMARAAQTGVGNRTQVHMADVPEERPATVATSISSAPGKASAQSASAPSLERPRAKLAHSSSTRHLSVVKSAKLAAAQGHPTVVPLVKAAPRVQVQAAPQTFAEAPIYTQPKREAAPRDSAATALDAALELCAEQSVFVRSWCEHRARARYCDAESWTPQECSVAVSNEHGN